MCRAKSFEFEKCVRVNPPTIRCLCANLGHVLGEIDMNMRKCITIHTIVALTLS